MATSTLTLQKSSRSWPSAAQWLLFALQAAFVVLIDMGNDIFRGNIHPANSGEAVRNARDIVAFESAHGFFLEPVSQMLLRHTESILGLVITPDAIVDLANAVYGFAHIFVTLAVAAWVFARHRDRFPLVRNVMIVTNALAVAAYEIFPVAPPRLTTGILFDHHTFHFRDTMQHIIGSGRLNGVPIGYNAYSAMPSVHVAWALIAGLCLLWLARNPLLRALGIVYPCLMVFTVVLTGNHYLLDAIGGAAAVLVGIMVALAFQYWRAAIRDTSPTACVPQLAPSSPESASDKLSYSRRYHAGD